MHKCNRDSLGAFRIERDIYNVQTLPHERFQKVIPREFIVPEREELEREFFARLQGNRGSMGPIIGKIARAVVWAFIFPLYTFYAIGSSVYRYCQRIKQSIVAFYTPYVMRFQAYCIRISLKMASWRNAVYQRFQKVQSKLIEFRQHIYHFFFFPIERRVCDYLNRINKKYLLLKFKWTGWKLRGALAAEKIQRIRFKPNRWDEYSYAVLNRITTTRERIRFVVRSLITRTIVSVLYFSRWTKYKLRVRIKRTYIWAGVLSKYARRVLEDWILEIKQSFQ